MNFRQLSPKVQAEILKISKDDDFQKRFAEDKQLDQIEKQKTNFQDEIMYQQILHAGGIKVNGRLYSAISPAVWSYLWTIQSPFVSDQKQITLLDLDVFMYLLQNGVGDADQLRIINDSIGYIEKNKIPIEDAITAIKHIIELSFKCLTLFPSLGGKNTPEYDLDWLTSMVTRIHSITGYTPEFIMNGLSLTEVCYYFIQYRRISGEKNIEKRTPEEIIKLMDERATELVVDELIKRGAIKEEQKEQYIFIISQPPKK